MANKATFILTERTTSIDQTVYLVMEHADEVTGWVERLPVIESDEETALCLVIPLAPISTLTVREDNEEGPDA